MYFQGCWPETKVELPEKKKKKKSWSFRENNVNGPSINCVTGHLPKIAECVFKVRVFPVALKGFCIFLFPGGIIKKQQQKTFFIPSF